MRLSDIIGVGGRGALKVLSPSGGCGVCPRRRVDFVPATLVAGGQVLTVGEAPGQTEVERQEGFVGKSGELLRKVYAEFGIDTSWTNTIHCRPPRNANPTAREVACCLNQYVIGEVRGYPIVVLAGAVPGRAFFPEMATSHMRGNLMYHPDFPGQRFYSIYHPAYVLRNPHAEGEFRTQVERLSRIIKGEKRAWELVTGDSENYPRLLRETLDRGTVSLDIETAGEHTLESWLPTGRVTSIGLCSNPSTVLVTNESDAGFQLTIEALREFLGQRDAQIVGRHVGFDLVWLESRYGIKVRARWIHEVGFYYYQLRSYSEPSLKELVSRELDGYRYLVYQPHLERDIGLLSLYNGEDVLHSLALYRKALAELRKHPKTLDLCLRVGGPSDLALSRVTHHGIYFRRDQWEKVKEEAEQRRAAAVASWQKKDPSFQEEDAKGKRLEEYLFQRQGLPALRTTPSGKPSTDEEVLKDLLRASGGFHEMTTTDPAAAVAQFPGVRLEPISSTRYRAEIPVPECEYLEDLLTLRELDKLLSTYILPFAPDKDLVAPDSRVHSSYVNTSTDTGRLSSRRPNMQNIPRPKRIRGMFGAPKGWKFLQGDFSQIELRIVMCLARDPVGIAAYQSGSDLHTETARVFAPQPTKEHRTWAKPVNFGLVYGGSPETLQAYAQNTYGITFTLEQARQFHAYFFSTYAEVSKWHQACNAQLVTNAGWAESAVGHRHFYADWNHPHQGVRDHAFRAHINSKAQGPAAYMATYTLIIAQREFIEQDLPAHVVGTVHDSVLLEVREDCVDQVAQILLDAVKKVESWASPWFVVPLVMDLEVGDSWGYTEGLKVTA